MRFWNRLVEMVRGFAVRETQRRDRHRGVLQSRLCRRVSHDPTVLHDRVCSPAAEHVAGRIRIALTAPFVLEAESVNVGTSVGIATSPADAKTPQALLAFGDGAMYAAKGSR